MDTLAFHLSPVFAATCYLFAAAYYVRMLIPSKSTTRTAKARGLLASGALLHALFLVLTLTGTPELSTVAGNQLLLSFPFALSLLSWGVISLFLLLERRLQLGGVGAFLAPSGVLIMLYSSYLFHVEGTSEGQRQLGILLTLHIGAVVLSAILLIFAFAVSLALIAKDRLLKQNKLIGFQRKLPSLRLLDDLNSKLLKAGFCLMCFGLLAGFVFAFQHGIALFFDSRIIWAILTLLVYAVVVFARAIIGWRGTRAAWLAVAGFGMLLVLFFGSNSWQQTFHG